MADLCAVLWDLTVKDISYPKIVFRFDLALHINTVIAIFAINFQHSTPESANL